ncbi:YHS domain-containing (seleno)protein [Marinomonas posidonica]|uniref:YHS domain-containing protein n=1 Tax=Marinomonas posidonica (strain CECT 7376 / NCIMB 14433 / IVIA-Po-181) TaxID=491952 RepID=F6CY84_MARPP|nr:YHS domain-containing (seleno)protein [Marinomonas posidonica]AEF53411.1 YHS domain-containing protein [Marinomonas posidonica IVIA-Po-181]
MKQFIAMIILFASPWTWAEDPISTGYFSNKAVSGYDTVAYFTELRAIEGSAKFKAEYKGADWYFVSKKHLEMFLAEPEKYAPQYGGYCAWAVSANKSFASSDPEQWAIVDGKLYLNYNKSVKQKWNADSALHIDQADQNWPEMMPQ